MILDVNLLTIAQWAKLGLISKQEAVNLRENNVSCSVHLTIQIMHPVTKSKALAKTS